MEAEGKRSPRRAARQTSMFSGVSSRVGGCELSSDSDMAVRYCEKRKLWGENYDGNQRVLVGLFYNMTDAAFSSVSCPESLKILVGRR